MTIATAPQRKFPRGDSAGYPTPCGAPIVSQYARRNRLQISNLPASNPVLSLYRSTPVCQYEKSRRPTDIIAIPSNKVDTNSLNRASYLG